MSQSHLYPHDLLLVMTRGVDNSHMCQQYLLQHSPYWVQCKPSIVILSLVICHLRHPEHSSRPTFLSLLKTLSGGSGELLASRERDELPAQAMTLGAPLEAGRNLYPELQRSYYQEWILCVEFNKGYKQEVVSSRILIKLQRGCVQEYFWTVARLQ